MKFAKELERDLVPEWRLKYLDYKGGKKKLKAIRRALRTANQTPRFRRRGTNNFTPSPFDTAPQYSFLNRDKHAAQNGGRGGASEDLRALALKHSQNSQNSLGRKPTSSLSREIRRSPEEQPLNQNEDPRFPGLTRYGSIIGSPPTSGKAPSSGRGRAPPSLKLPGAALDPENASPQVGASAEAPAALPKSKSLQVPQPTDTDDAFKVGKTRTPHHASTMTLPSRYRSIFSPKRVNSTPGTPITQDTRPLMKRVFSMNHKAGPSSPADVPLEAYRELDIRQAEFFHFLDMELDKIEEFYKQREEESTARLNVLREQLHIMRDRRLDELISHKAAKIKAKERKKTAAHELLMNGHQSSSDEETNKAKGLSLNVSWLNPIDTALDAVRAGHYGKTTKAMNELATPGALSPQENPDHRRDYVRRPDTPDIPYATAKKKLKVAMQEYYRGLELLKSYSLLNRTAFRKINKKYDKTVNARPSMRYMTEKVNKAWFVQSDVVEGHIRAVEDLYARYFERGNHKVAVGKLRIKIARAGDFTENSFRNGLTLAAGAVFGIQGLVYGLEHLHDPRVGTQTSYLLQIYAGYFLMNFLFLLFSIACRVWHNSKINYVFVFEYDTRHHLDWRQLAELPCFFFFLLGMFMWLNFMQFGDSTMYLYYPVILIGITAVILFLPLPILYFRSRQWLIYSTWRLLLAGLYPVEFRDFYLGDMFCSLTYAMGNIELFFCLYANRWDNPPICNSSNSRLLGFFTALPGIWRALQCIRRYYDTRNVFPHLVNCGKYTATIMFYVTLSVYRLNKTQSNHALFITFAMVNSIYCSIWDVIMDWSLGDPHAKHRFLRTNLGYKKAWMYYVAMVIDPILRFNWIPYAVLPLQLQHSAVTSFVVAISEVLRRGMWTLFRVENEHCTNVGRFRASRDVPLPYDVPSPGRTSAESRADGDTQRQSLGQLQDHEPQQSPHMRRTSTAPHFGDDLERQQSRSLNLHLSRSKSSAHRRATSYTAGAPAAAAVESPSMLNRVGTILRDAHAQDFERKKKPELGSKVGGTPESDTDDDEEDDKVDSRDSDSDEEEEHVASGANGNAGRAGGSGAGQGLYGSSAGRDHDEGDEESREEISEVRRDVDIGSGRVQAEDAERVGEGHV